DSDDITCNDILIVSGTEVMLRSERDGDYLHNGRVYTIEFEVSDPSGNTTLGQCIVKVPHDQSGADTVRDSCRYCEDRGGDPGSCTANHPNCPQHDPNCTY